LILDDYISAAGYLRRALKCLEGEKKTDTRVKRRQVSPDGVASW
jgi:hypothetical protein